MTKQEFAEMEKFVVDKIKICLDSISGYSTSSTDLKASKAADNLVETLWFMKDLVEVESEDKSE